MAGDADLARDVDEEERDEDVLRDAALRAREPAAGAAREEALRVVAFFADFLADFFAVLAVLAVFAVAAFARFAFA